MGESRSTYYTNIFVTDSKIQKILIVIEKGFLSSTEGIWRVHNEHLGWLAVNRGTVTYYKPTNTLYLLGSDGTWGIMFNNYKKQSGYVNMEGSYGTLLQPWVLAFESGDIAWDAPHGTVRL